MSLTNFKNRTTLLSHKTSKKIRQMIDKGYSFTLKLGDHRPYHPANESWSADFVKKKKDGLWETFRTGYSNTPDDAIDIAIQNIQNQKQ